MDKNNIGLKNAINYTFSGDNILSLLFRQNPSNIEDWLNLLSNICSQCEINIKKEYIDETLNYIKRYKQNKFSNIDYESINIILNKFIKHMNQE